MPEQDNPVAAARAVNVVTPADVRARGGRRVPGSLGLVLGEALAAPPPSAILGSASGREPTDQPGELAGLDQVIEPTSIGRSLPTQPTPRRRPLLLWGSLVEPPVVLRSNQAVVRVVSGCEFLSPSPSLASGRVRRPSRPPASRPRERVRPSVPAAPQPFAASALERTSQGGSNAAPGVPGSEDAGVPTAVAPSADATAAKPSARKFRLPRSVGELAGSVPPPPQLG
jgi:hypothetical protein